MDGANKELIVAVPPKRQEGQPYFDGYDYKSIGQTADKVILMAHDYEPKRLTEEEKKSFTGTIPSLAPIKDVYYALRYALDKDKGIPADKLLLQISFNSVLWEFKDGKVINDFPVHLDYGAVNKWLNDDSIYDKQLNYSDAVQAPYFTFVERDTEIKKIAWFEDERSVRAKIKLAQLFGAKGISIWRIGLVPDFEDEPGQPPCYLNVWSVLNDFCPSNMK